MLCTEFFKLFSVFKDVDAFKPEHEFGSGITLGLGHHDLQHRVTIAESFTYMILYLQIVKIRTAQNDEGVDSQLLPTQSFTAPQLEMLRHAFELLCADSAEDQAQGVYREQVAEIMVMAGLELSAPDTLQIITQLVSAAA